MTHWRWARIPLFCLLTGLTGCGSVSYYAQSINGHLNIVSAGRSVDRLLDEPSRDSDLKEQLKLARDIRQFASEELALPDNDSYRNYVDTGREYAIWSVFAAPELSPGIKTWCFPVAGCVPYRGYFSREAADRYARQIENGGLDVYVGGVPAYSTLGWFDDPLLNTMFRYGETYLAGIVFHELAHQRVYVADDAEFNEAFAVAVEQAGTLAWLKSRGETAKLRHAYSARKRNQDFLRLVADARRTLAAVYASRATDRQKRMAKALEIGRLRARYRQMKNNRWNGYGGYDQWFNEPINNAKLATIAVYNDLAPAFERLLKICSHDYERFYGTVERIGEMGHERRRASLRAAMECE